MFSITDIQSIQTNPAPLALKGGWLTQYAYFLNCSFLTQEKQYCPSTGICYQHSH